MLKPVRGWLLASTLLLVATNVCAQDFYSAAADFTARIAGRVTPSAVSFSVKNNSSITESEVESIQSEIVRQLQARGYKITRPQENQNSVVVTLGESLSKFIWTAEITIDDKRDVVFFELPRPDSNQTTAAFSLSRTLLVTSSSPVLDVTLLEGKVAEGAHLVALTPDSAQLYQMQSSQWRLVQSQPLGVTALASRDLRGRITPDQGNRFDAYLPETHCAGAVAPSFTITCHASDDPWPLSDDRHRLGFYAARRNYFTGVIRVQGGEIDNVGAFYSDAVLNDRVLYSQPNGRVGVELLVMHTASSTAQSWGSNITGIQSSCGSELVLATASGDFREDDSLTAFKPSADFSAASEAISFSGPITTLKTSADRQQALAVVSSLSGRYEAYLVTARCGA